MSIINGNKTQKNCLCNYTSCGWFWLGQIAIITNLMEVLFTFIKNHLFPASRFVPTVSHTLLMNYCSSALTEFKFKQLKYDQFPWICCFLGKHITLYLFKCLLIPTFISTFPNCDRIKSKMIYFWNSRNTTKFN